MSLALLTFVCISISNPDAGSEAQSFAAAKQTTAKPTVELVEPQAYAVKRFEEVVRGIEESEPTAPEEKLIAYRARLAIAERQFSELKQERADESTTTRPSVNTPGEKAVEPKKENTVKVTTLRASQARIDHYEKMIAQLEQKLLAEKRKERSAPVRKKTKKPAPAK